MVPTNQQRARVCAGACAPAAAAPHHHSFTCYHRLQASWRWRERKVGANNQRNRVPVETSAVARQLIADHPLSMKSVWIELWAELPPKGHYTHVSMDSKVVRIVLLLLIVAFYYTRQCLVRGGCVQRQRERRAVQHSRSQAAWCQTAAIGESWNSSFLFLF